MQTKIVTDIKFIEQLKNWKYLQLNFVQFAYIDNS